MATTSAIADERLSQILSLLASDKTNQDAWRSLYVVLWPYVFASTYRMLRGDQSLAQDVSQEVFLRLAKYGNFEELQNPRVFRAYVVSICRNTARSSIKEAFRHDREMTGKTDFNDQEIARSIGFPEASAYADQIAAQMSESLDPTSRFILDKMIEGYSLTEIAEQLGLTYSAAAVRVHRLKGQLLRFLAEKQAVPSAQKAAKAGQ